jgi:hypothetical protein
LLKRFFDWLLVSSLTEFCRWSTLGAVGRSNVGRLTILIPLVGYLLIFNPSFSTFFESRIPGGVANAPAALVSLHSNRLNFLYFGLLFLGTGIALYTAFAPEQIRNYHSASDYIQDMEKVWSPSLIGNTLDSVCSRFLALHDKGDTHPIFSIGHPSFPAKPSSYLHQLIARLFGDLPEGAIPESEWEVDQPGTMVLASPYCFVGLSGHILTDKIMQVMYSGRLVDRAVLAEMHAAANDQRKELFYVDYVSSDYRMYGIRLLIFSMFLTGFFLLLVPTTTTSMLVLIAASQ